MLKKWILLALLLIPLLAACDATPASSVQLPDYVQSAAPNVQLAYKYAVEHPEMLTHQPCYCGCNTMGHMNNLECYVSSRDEDSGEIVFDNHALMCGICVDITLDVLSLSKRGKSPLEIRQFIDTKYSRFGPTTDTPLPEA